MAEKCNRKILVNLAVRDFQKSMGFFSHLGFGFDSRFTDEKAACLIISEDAYVMLLMEPFFKGFTKLEPCDTEQTDRGIARAFLRQPRRDGKEGDRGRWPAGDGAARSWLHVRLELPPTTPTATIGKYSGWMRAQHRSSAVSVDSFEKEKINAESHPVFVVRHDAKAGGPSVASAKGD